MPWTQHLPGRDLPSQGNYSGPLHTTLLPVGTCRTAFRPLGLFVFHKIFLARIFTQGYSWEVLPKSCQKSYPLQEFCSINTRHHKNFCFILRALCKSNGLQDTITIGARELEHVSQSDEIRYCPNPRGRLHGMWPGKKKTCQLSQRKGANSEQISFRQNP